jgi:hypothetical protein
MSETRFERPSPDVFYAVVSNADEADTWRLVFGPVCHEELAYRALEEIDANDGTFTVRRGTLQSPLIRFEDQLQRERALLELAALAPLNFRLSVTRGVAHPLVVAFVGASSSEGYP